MSNYPAGVNDSVINSHHVNYSEQPEPEFVYLKVRLLKIDRHNGDAEVEICDDVFVVNIDELEGVRK